VYPSRRLNLVATKTIQVLGAARLSKDADESTSIERQSSGINGWTDLRSNTTGDLYNVVHVTEDSDVPGAVSPFDRAGLGPYLRRPLLDTWQVLVVFRLDRLTRSIAHFEAIWKFLEGNGKTLVSVAEQIDFGTTAGRLMARQLVIFAEYEREMISARVKNAWDAARQQGKYPGLMFPFGYWPVKLPEKGWGLEPHPVYGEVIVPEICRRLIAGNSLSSICQWLDAEGIPTPRNAVREYKGKKPVNSDARWNTTSVTSILRSPNVIGETTANGDVIRDETGMAIHRADPLIDRKTWEQVKAILDGNTTRHGPSSNSSPLLHVAYCDLCKGPLHCTSAKWDGKLYRYYRCYNEEKRKDCNARRMPAGELEAIVTNHMLNEVGDFEILDTHEIPGIDYSTQMAEVAEAIGALSSQIALARVHSHDTTRLEQQQAIRETNLANLRRDGSLGQSRNLLANPGHTAGVVSNGTVGMLYSVSTRSRYGLSR
jgi:site-specific DNA recombinase